MIIIMKKGEIVSFGDTFEVLDASCTAAAAYADSGVYIALNDLDRIISFGFKRKISSEFERIGRSDLYRPHLLVRVLAEEFAHFVQHTRGQLSVNTAAEFADTKNISVKQYGVELSEYELKLVQPLMNRVFFEMEYKGRPPKKGVTVICGQIKIDKEKQDGIIGLSEQYYKDMHTPKLHASRKHLFEANAAIIRSKVLRWWFLEVEKLPFAFT